MTTATEAAGMEIWGFTLPEWLGLANWQPRAGVVASGGE